MLNENRNRWVLIPYLGETQIKKIHAEENRREQEAKAQKRTGIDSTHWSAELSGNFLYQIVHDAGLNPFWIGKIEESEKSNRIANFIQLIYPVWCGIEKRWEETFNSGKSESELEILHRIDWAIAESGHKVDRMASYTPTEKIKKADSWEGR